MNRIIYLACAITLAIPLSADLLLNDFSVNGTTVVPENETAIPPAYGSSANNYFGDPGWGSAFVSASGGTLLMDAFSDNGGAVWTGYLTTAGRPWVTTPGVEEGVIDATPYNAIAIDVRLTEFNGSEVITVGLQDEDGVATEGSSMSLWQANDSGFVTLIAAFQPGETDLTRINQYQIQGGFQKVQSLENSSFSVEIDNLRLINYDFTLPGTFVISDFSAPGEFDQEPFRGSAPDYLWEDTEDESFSWTSENVKAIDGVLKIGGFDGAPVATDYGGSGYFSQGGYVEDRPWMGRPGVVWGPPGAETYRPNLLDLSDHRLFSIDVKVGPTNETTGFAVTWRDLAHVDSPTGAREYQQLIPVNVLPTGEWVTMFGFIRTVPEPNPAIAATGVLTRPWLPFLNHYMIHGLVESPSSEEAVPFDMEFDNLTVYESGPDLDGAVAKVTSFSNDGVLSINSDPDYRYQLVRFGNDNTLMGGPLATGQPFIGVGAPQDGTGGTLTWSDLIIDDEDRGFYLVLQYKK